MLQCVYETEYEPHHQRAVIRSPSRESVVFSRRTYTQTSRQRANLATTTFQTPMQSTGRTQALAESQTITKLDCCTLP